MATGTFTYNTLRTKTLKERIKAQRKIVSHSNLTRVMQLEKEKTAVEAYLSMCPVGLVWFAKMYSRHLFSYGGFKEATTVYITST